MTISMDYCLSGGIREDQEEEERQSTPLVLVLQVDGVDPTWAMMVSSKGVREEVAGWILQRLEFAGYSGNENHHTRKSRSLPSRERWR